MPVLCLRPRGWGGLSWNMTNISFVLGLVGLSLNYLTWGSKCYIQHLVMPAFQVTFLKCTERLIFFLPVTRTVLPFDVHDLLLNLICTVSFCFLLLVLPGAPVLLIWPWRGILTHHICLKYAWIPIVQGPLPKLFLNLFELHMGRTIFHLHHHKQSEAQPLPSWEPGYKAQSTM